jgi:hypothetical protein
VRGILTLCSHFYRHGEIRHRENVGGEQHIRRGPGVPPVPITEDVLGTQENDRGYDQLLFEIGPVTYVIQEVRERDDEQGGLDHLLLLLEIFYGNLYAGVDLLPEPNATGSRVIVPFMTAEGCPVYFADHIYNR